MLGPAVDRTDLLVWHLTALDGHFLATELLESVADSRTVQERLGHNAVKTTMHYTHVLNRGGLGVRSSLDVRR